MVSLARYVRNRSAQELTTKTLANLDLLMSRYVTLNGGQLPPVTQFIPTSAGFDEESLRDAALRNNRDFVRALQSLRRPGAGGLSVFDDLPIGIYDEISLRDAWGNPIVFMPKMHPLIGMAPQDRYFFFSAGPDRRFLSRDDNLYSYETSAEAGKAEPK
jgi:hypothetical protein